MSLIKFKSIRQKITVLCGLFLIMTVALIVAYTVSSVRETAIQTAKAQALATAREKAAEISGELEEALNSANTLAETLSAVKDEEVLLDITREAVNGILRIVLEGNPQFLGVYTCWEMDRFDEMDEGFADTDSHDSSGRLIPYWYRDAEGVARVRPILDYENQTADANGSRPGDFYLIPRETRHETILNPNLRTVQDKRQLVVPLAVPIITDDTFHATVGIDLVLDHLQKDADGIDIYNHSAQIFVFSQNGTLVSATGSPDKVGQRIDSSFEGTAQILTEIKSGNESAAFVGDWLRVTVPMHVGRTETNWGVIIRIPKANILATASEMMWMQIWLGVGCVVVALILLWLVAVSITKPIRQTTDLLKDIAQGEGDLTRRLTVNSSDEIGEQAKWFNIFVQKIHDVIIEVSRSADDVTHNASRIATSSNETSEKMREQATQTTQVAAAVEQMAASIAEVARMSSEATSTAQSSGENARAGGEVVGDTVESIKSISQSVKESAMAINELGKRGDQIGQIIGVINDIADQTNLLALNAAIEAARAGEHGRGFAVVADEVRKLADRTTQATGEVAESVNAIQSETKKAVARMNTGSERVQSGVELAERAGQSLGEIVSGSHEVSEMIMSIAAAAEQQSATASEIASSIESINSLLGKSTDTTVASAMEADDMSSMARHLQQLVGQFKVDSDLTTNDDVAIATDAAHG